MGGQNPYEYRTPPFVPEQGEMAPTGGKNPFAGLFGEGMDMNAMPEEPQVVAPQVQPPPSPVPMDDGMMDIGKRISEMYTPESGASERFNRMIDEAPVRNKPGWLRSIAAGLTNYAAGPQAADAVAFGDFGRRQEDWKTKIGPAREAATLERQSNINERTLAMQTISAELREQAQRHKEANDTQRADIAQQRANVYEYKARNPNLQFNFTGPTVKIADPSTGELKDTGIPTGNISEADKLMLQQENTLEAIGATGRETRTTQEAGHEQDMDEILARGEEARTTKSTPSGSASGKDELPTQTRVRQFNAARELYNSNPELSQFIKVGAPGSNDFQVTLPSEHRLWGHQGPTAEQHKQITDAIYGGALTRQVPKTDTPPPAGQQPQVLTKTQTNNATGEKRTLVSTDGGKTWKVQGATAAR